MVEGAFAVEFDGYSTLSVSGELDDGSIDALSGALTHAAKEAPALRVDLSAVTFLPSTAVGELILALKAAESDGRVLVLTARTGTAAHMVLDVMGIRHQSA